MSFFRAIQKNQYRPTRKTYGKGKVGPKTFQLRKDWSALEKAGFTLPCHASFTPGFFDNFLQRAGVLECSSKDDIVDKIHATSFNAEEKQAILDAILSFPPELRMHIFVRSDEYAGGTGVYDSDIVSTCKTTPPTKEELKKLVKGIEHEFKSFLFQDLIGDYQLFFKKRLGITERAGVLLMPVFADSFLCSDGKELIANPLSVNFIGFVNGNFVASTGIGIGGANVKSARRFRKRQSLIYSVPPHSSEDYSFLNPEEGLLRHPHVGTLDKDSLFYDEGKRFREMFFVEAFENFVSRLKGFSKVHPEFLSLLFEMIEEFQRISISPRYFEFVVPSLEVPLWMPVQSALFEVKPVKKPYVDKTQFHVFECWEGSSGDEGFEADSGDQIVGTKVVESNTISYTTTTVNFDNNFRKKAGEFNKQNKGYVAVINSNWLPFMDKEVLINLFSNASAIIINSHSRGGQIRSHLSGLSRALDIPIIVFQKEDFQKIFPFSWEKGQDANILQRKCIVYANEFQDEGFFAVEK